MTQQMMVHDGLCATSGIGNMVCPENPVRQISVLASLFAVFSVIAYFSTRSPLLLDRTTPAVSHRHKRMLLTRAFSPGLQPLFADGILNAKTY
jgi:hypothetical protein